MAKPTPTSATLAQQRSAQAARAFLNRPQAGQQGAPQNRQERRQAARVAGRRPKEASFNTAATQAEAARPFKAREYVAAAPAAIGDSAVGAVRQLHRGFVRGAIFPVRALMPALLFMVVVSVLAALWFGVAGLHTGALAPYAAYITAGLWTAFGLGAAVLSWRSVLPPVAALVVSMSSAGAGQGPHFFNWLLVAFGLALAWLLGPQVGDVFNQNKRATPLSRD